MTDVAGGFDLAHAVAIQPDGRIVVAGFAEGSGFGIARYTSAGALDDSFSLDGIATAFSSFSRATGVAVQADGKIVVAGTSANFDFAIARLTATGSLDTSFSGDGEQTTEVGLLDSVSGLALQPDGKAVVVGTTYVGDSNSDFALARYDGSGALDPTFAGDGTTTTPFPADPDQNFDFGAAVALQPDGAIVVAGSANRFSSDTSGIVADKVGLARYDASGALDPSFSGDGLQTTRIDPATSGDEGGGVAIQEDGRIVVAATTNLTPGSSGRNFGVIRYSGGGGPTPTPTVTPAVTPTVVPYVVPTPTPTPPSGGDQLLACANRRVVLEDVVPAGKQVRLLGVADRAFAGQPVELRFLVTKKIVATPTVGPDGRFAATVKLPPKKQQRLKRSRYQAQIGAAGSQSLKLFRRVYVDKLTAIGGQVAITGRVIGPLAPKKKDRTLLLRRYVTCKDLETVTTVTPDRKGRFTVTAPGPAGLPAAVYQLATRVRLEPGAKRVAKAFTLPRAVDFTP